MTCHLALDMIGHGIGPDPNSQTLPLLITFYINIYYYCLLTQPRGPTRCTLHHIGLTPNWAWPIEVRRGPCLLYKEVFTSLFG
ncbi:hypothetical protein Hanom_Chr01g00044231 [Helianthus anomalus]